MDTEKFLGELSNFKKEIISRIDYSSSNFMLEIKNINTKCSNVKSVMELLKRENEDLKNKLAEQDAKLEVLNS